MTDDTGLPTAVGSRQRSRRVFYIAFAALVVLAAAVIAWVWMAGVADQGDADGGAFIAGSAGDPMVAWSGSGRYAVVQYYREFLYPSVAVWDRQTGKTRTVDGYRLLFAEPAAPQIWLEPVTARETDSATWLDGLSDAFDHKPAQLAGWRLDGDGGPSPRVSSKWRRWPGPGGYIAYPEISVLKGAGPSALWFNNEASSGEGFKAELPKTTNTFAPVGWSPSGRYFAIEELARESDYLGPNGAMRSTEATVPFERNLVVFDATTGKVSASALLPTTARVGQSAVWDASADRLFWPVGFETETTDPLELRTMTATGTAQDAFSELGWQRPAELPRAYDVRALGWSSKGSLLLLDGLVYRIAADGLALVGPLEAEQGAYFQDAGIAGVLSRYSEDEREAWVELVILGDGGRRVVWESPRSKMKD